MELKNDWLWGYSPACQSDSLSHCSCASEHLPFPLLQPPAAVTSLVHFSTSVSLAQVVVVGTQAGTVSWYIAQPPQKTYSLLSFSQPHFPHSVVALQVCVQTHRSNVHVHVCVYAFLSGLVEAALVYIHACTAAWVSI